MVKFNKTCLIKYNFPPKKKPHYYIKSNIKVILNLFHKSQALETKSAHLKRETK